MMGALWSFCVAVGALFLWLINTYDGDEEQPKEQQGGQQIGRKRNRRKGGKKATGKGQPARPTDDATDKEGTPTPANGSMAPVLNSEKNGNNTGGNNTGGGGGGGGGGGKKQRSSRARGAAKQQKLDVNEWPTLLGNRGGGVEPSQPTRPSRQPEEEEEEDLAALHAELLKASKGSSRATVAPGGAASSNGGTADRGGKTGTIGVGDKVEGRFEGGVEWFPAIVTKTLHGGLVNLLYDDGERETRVSLSLVRHRGERGHALSGSDSVSDTDSEEEPARAYHHTPVAGGSKPRDKGWEVITQKPKKTSQERVESRAEASSNLKNRIKRQKKREKEIAAREALRKKL